MRELEQWLRTAMDALATCQNPDAFKTLIEEYEAWLVLVRFFTNEGA